MAFNLPQRTSIGAQPPTTPAVWTRPSDWISITGVSTGEILFLVSDATSSNNAKYNFAMTKTGAGNVYIDWGDGTSTTVSSNATYSHTYTTGGTACSLGYNTWKITITSDVGTRITGARIVYDTDYSGTPYGLLEGWYGDTTVITAASYFGNAQIVLPYLSYVKLPEGMTATDALYRTIAFNPSIKKLDFPVSLSACTNMDGFATNCYSLIEINQLPQDMTEITGGQNGPYQAFDNCSSLQKIICPPRWDSVTSLARFARNSVSLTTLVLPSSLNNCIDFTVGFDGCTSLTSIAIPTLKASSTIEFNSAFNGNSNLRNVTFANNTPSTTTLSLNSTFGSCFNLQSVILPPNVKVTALSSTFINCYSLKTIVLPMDGSSITTMASTFQNCQSLTNITLPTTAPSIAISMANIFQNCYALSEITIPSTYNITSLSAAFTSCRLLKTATLPQSSQNSLTTFASTFSNCLSLQSVNLPTAMTSVTTCSSMFNDCRSLTGATFPASMPSLTIFTSTFQNCSSLQSVTLPTTINGNSAPSFQNTFNGCENIKSIILPATITNNTIPTSMLSTFQNCYSLKSVTLPTSNLTSVTNMNSTFNGCRSLTGVTNMSSIGSSSPTGPTANGTNLATDARSLLSLTLVPRFSKLEVYGTVGFLSALNSLRLQNTGAGQWGGTSPQIDVSYTSLDAAALNTLFGDLTTIVSKTINITGTPGAATCTRSIATAKGWTVTG
jgi:hypothetical protein